MKRLFVSFLALVMVLSLVACGQQKPDTGDVDLTAPEVLEQLKAALGDTYGCDTADDEDWITNYYGLDMSRIDSWASESYSISSIDPPAPPWCCGSRTAMRRTPPPCCRSGTSRCGITVSCTA